MGLFSWPNRSPAFISLIQPAPFGKYIQARMGGGQVTVGIGFWNRTPHTLLLPLPLPPVAFLCSWLFRSFGLKDRNFGNLMIRHEGQTGRLSALLGPPEMAESLRRASRNINQTTVSAPDSRRREEGTWRSHQDPTEIAWCWSSFPQGPNFAGIVCDTWLIKVGFFFKIFWSRCCWGSHDQFRGHRFIRWRWLWLCKTWWAHLMRGSWNWP